MIFYITINIYIRKIIEISKSTSLQIRMVLQVDTYKIKSYYKIVTRVTNNVTKDTIKEKLEVDATTYASIVTGSETITLDDSTTVTQTISKETESYYDYEINVNEAKRRIRLLKPEYVAKNSLVNELIRVLGT